MRARRQLPSELVLVGVRVVRVRVVRARRLRLRSSSRALFSRETLRSPSRLPRRLLQRGCLLQRVHLRARRAQVQLELAYLLLLLVQQQRHAHRDVRTRGFARVGERRQLGARAILRLSRRGDVALEAANRQTKNLVAPYGFAVQRRDEPNLVVRSIGRSRMIEHDVCVRVDAFELRRPDQSSVRRDERFRLGGVFSRRRVFF